MAQDSKVRDAKQRHHDHYVQLHRGGRLPADDIPQYQLAMRRERAGEVKPLPEDQGLIRSG